MTAVTFHLFRLVAVMEDDLVHYQRLQPAAYLRQDIQQLVAGQYQAPDRSSGTIK
jgi:hypothetical protein